SGALGFEAASRGAAEVTLIEQDAALVAQLQKNKDHLKAEAAGVQLTVRRGDGIAALAAWPVASLDLVFLDPPFDAQLFEPALKAAARVVKAGACIYLEAPSEWTAESLEPLGLMPQRHLKAGAVHAHLLRRD
ncbi:RsmD family RNA methyltransferase, partial [Leptospira sp. 96542]|nr:RsmD family RNA methyltransferase [Leptospira sp. 96542]